MDVPPLPVRSRRKCDEAVSSFTTPESKAREEVQWSGHGTGNGFGIAQRQGFGHQFSHHQREIGNRQDDHTKRQRLTALLTNGMLLC